MFVTFRLQMDSNLNYCYCLNCNIPIAVTHLTTKTTTTLGSFVFSITEKALPTDFDSQHITFPPNISTQEKLDRLKARASFLRDRVIMECTIDYTKDKFFRICSTSQEDAIRFTIVLCKNMTESNYILRTNNIGKHRSKVELLLYNDKRYKIEFKCLGCYGIEGRFKSLTLNEINNTRGITSVFPHIQ